MRAALITSGTMPLPAVKGGAVETLAEHYLRENERTHRCEFTVYSVYDERVKAFCGTGRLTPSSTRPNGNAQAGAQRTYSHAAFKYVRTDNLFYKIRRKAFALTHKGLYYDPHIEYFLRSVLNDVRDGAFDYVIIENRPGFVLPVAQVSTARVILHVHNDMLSPAARQAKDIVKACYRVVTVSDYLAAIVRTLHCREDNIVTIHNGIDLTKYYDHAAGDAARRQVGFDSNDLVIVFIGRVIPEKGLLEAVKAVATLTDLPDVRLLVVGSSVYGAEEQTDYVRAVRAAATQLPEGTVTFTGFVPYDDTPRYLHAADIAILPSLWDEPAGLTVVECMAAGLPVITTRAGGIPEYADDTTALFVSRENAVDSIAAAIRRLHDSPALRARLAQGGRQRAALFDAHTYANNFLSLMA